MELRRCKKKTTQNYEKSKRDIIYIEQCKVKNHIDGIFNTYKRGALNTKIKSKKW